MDIYQKSLVPEIVRLQHKAIIKLDSYRTIITYEICSSISFSFIHPKQPYEVATVESKK
jgi:hypothetical protein